LLLEAATLDTAEWDVRCGALGSTPAEQLITEIQAAVDVAVNGSEPLTVASVDQIVRRLVSLSLHVLSRYASERLLPANDPIVRKTVECFASVIRRWYGPEKWNGEFVPKAGADELAMDFALMMAQPGLSMAYEDWVQETLRNVARDVSDLVLQGYILDVVCHDDG
jgi:hypothetical protein